MYRLMIVEDDPGIAAAVAEAARKWELEMHIAQDFEHITAEFAACMPHLLLLDITLPFFDGYHWCREIRRISSVPILFLSSASENMNIVMAMNLGADDFITKPFDRSVLMVHFAPPSGHWCVYSGHSALPVARLNRPLFVQS